MSRVALTFVLLTALSILTSCSRIESFDQVNIATLPQLDYCELRSDPDRYDGKIVKLRAQLGNFGHGYYFDDERYSKKTYENLLDDNRTEVRFFKPRTTDLDAGMGRPGFVCCDTKPTSVIAVGRFTRQFPTSHTDLMADRTSFHFELYSIEPANQ